MILYLVTIIAGIALLVWSADRFVDGGAASARHLQVSPLVIGLVIMGFGTSAPELMVSSLAALEGSPGIGIGNAIGSNIANIALVLGTTALILPIAVRSNILRREFPLLLVVTAACGVILYDHTLSRLEGGVLLLSLLLMMAWLIHSNKESAPVDSLLPEVDQAIDHEMSLRLALLWTLIGLLLLLLSSRLIVWAAVGIAQQLQISELVIGLTIIAIGTSLPELAASISAALKQEHDMAIGNIIGSNLFNTLGVLALPGLIAPGTIDAMVFNRDYLLMAVLTILLFLMATRLTGASRSISRLEGGLLLSIFGTYLWLLYRQTTTI